MTLNGVFFPFECSRGVLVGPDDGGVDRYGPVDVVDGIRCGEDGDEDLLPRAVDGPPDQPLMGRLKRAELLGEVPQGELVRYFHAMASSVPR